MTTIENGKKAKTASYKTAMLNEEKRNDALITISEDLIHNTDEILEINKKDIENAKENGIRDIMLDRLTLNKERIIGISAGVKQVAELKSEVGTIIPITKRPNGLSVYKKIVPLGVVAMIYESRPNVTVDAAALALKSGNSIILRGGKEAFLTNCILVKIMQNSLKKVGIDPFAIQLVEDISRESAKELMTMNKYVDVLIPRGGSGLIKSVVENATVGVIETGVGNCHIYVDESADLKMAKDIIINAKVSRPSVCNSAESLLINEKIAEEFLPVIYDSLQKNGVTLYGCEKSVNIVPCKKADEEDFYKEYLGLEMSAKIVTTTEEAIEHINKYGTHHTDSIISENKENVEKFLNGVDSAAVYHNASTRFTDGFEFGFGAEIGISTQKLHVRGPMGLNALTTYKYIVLGEGQTR